MGKENIDTGVLFIKNQLVKEKYRHRSGHMVKAILKNGDTLSIVFLS